jgi:hypothetical protein
MTTPVERTPNVAAFRPGALTTPPRPTAGTAATLPAGMTPGPAPTPRGIGPIASLTDPVKQARPPTLAKTPPMAAGGDDDLMSQHQ